MTIISEFLKVKSLEIKSLLISRVFLFVDEFLVFKSGYQIREMLFLLFFLPQQTILVFFMNEHVRLLILEKKIHNI